MKPIANPGDSRLNGIGDGTDHRIGQRIFGVLKLDRRTGIENVAG